MLNKKQSTNNNNSKHNWCHFLEQIWNKKNKQEKKSVQLKSDKNNARITRIVEANRNNKMSYCNIFSDQIDILAAIKILQNSSPFVCVCVHTIAFKLVEIRIETIDFH